MEREEKEYEGGEGQTNYRRTSGQMNISAQRASWKSDDSNSCHEVVVKLGVDLALVEPAAAEPTSGGESMGPCWAGGDGRHNTASSIKAPNELLSVPTRCITYEVR